MPTRFICLGNSFKEGGRCIAGVELDINNNPILANGRPKWIRPICDTPHGEVPTHLVSEIHLLDLIEIDGLQTPQVLDYQSENVLFSTDSIEIVGHYNNDLNLLCDNRNVIFGNRGKAVSQEAINNLTYSLMLVSTNEFEVIEKVYDDCTNRPQARLLFNYRGNQYDLPITDPVFLHRYRQNPDFMNGINHVFLSLSLGVCWNDWYYKLVAGIINPAANAPVVHGDLEDDLPY